MSRPLTRNQLLENTAFLKALGRSGNVRLAAREIGKAYSTMQHRRAHHPAFALKWDVAVVHASARLHAKGGARRPESRAPGPDGAHRTVGGEPVVVRLKSGKLQVRAAQPGKLTKQCEQAFLLALSASANIALAARAAGAAEAAFFRRRRRDAAFAREWQAALALGYERVETAALADSLPKNHEHDAWRHNDAPALPTMTANQMLQLLYLHQKEARLAGNPFETKRGRGEPREAYHYRMTVLAEAWLQRERDKYDAAEAVRRAARERVSPHEVPIVLPALDQVTGWSKASGKPPAEEGVALFSGFRVKHLTAEQQAKGLAARRR